VRTIMQAVEYIHRAGIVHRDLKPENLIFRTKAEDAEVMIADFGLSRVMDDSTFTLLTEVCGTPGYMAPEIFQKIGHSKPVDIWAMGVITYFLLCGYTPFDRETQQEEAAAICRGDYKFEPEEYWANVSDTAKSFVRACLTCDQHRRPTATEALQHPWLASTKPHFVADPASATGQPADLLPQFQRAFNARKTFRKAVLGIMASKRMASASSQAKKKHALLPFDLDQMKEDAEAEHVDERRAVTVHVDGSGSSESGGGTPPSHNPNARPGQTTEPSYFKSISGSGEPTASH